MTMILVDIVMHDHVTYTPQLMSVLFYATGALVRRHLTEVGLLTPVEPIGCQLLPDDIIVFHVRGNTGLRLTGGYCTKDIT